MRGLFLENNNEIEIQNTEEISMVDKQNDYNENQIQVLEGLEAVRKDLVCISDQQVLRDFTTLSTR